MRWDELFRDLEAQFEAEASGDLAGELADRARRESSHLRLVDRLLPAVGRAIRLRVSGAGDIGGHLRQVAAEALLVEEPGGRHALVPLSAILAVAGARSSSAVPGSQGRVFERLRLAAALRELARDRVGVRIVLRDGAVLTGTVDRVGQDFFEIAEHAEGEPRLRDHVTGVRLVPLAAIGLVRSY